MNNGLVNFLESQFILSKTQYRWHVHDFTDLIVRNNDGEKKNISIIIDLVKAFDIVYITNIIDKLDKIGIRGTQFNLLTDYFTNQS